MANVAAHKNIGPSFSNQEELVKIIYDFAKDGGAAGTYTLATAGADCVITGFHAVVKTACTSAGAATVQVGDNIDDDLYLTATAVASLTADATFGENGAFNQVDKLSSGGALNLIIAAAALTAGKIECSFKVQRI